MMSIMNTSDAPIVRVIGGRAYVFPPAGSKLYWRVEEDPKAKIGESPYKTVTTDHAVASSVRGPLVSVTESVGKVLKVFYPPGPSNPLLYGAEADKAAGVIKEKMADDLQAAHDELARVRAELAADKAKLEARIAAEEASKSRK